MDPHLNALSKHLTTSSGDISWNKTEKQEGRTREGLLLPSLVPERKRTRNIGSKSKRLLIDSQDALELKLTWEEAQDLLRPPPASKPSTVVIEDLEFEEYEVSGFIEIFQVTRERPVDLCMQLFLLIDTTLMVIDRVAINNYKFVLSRNLQCLERGVFSQSGQLGKKVQRAFSFAIRLITQFVLL